MTELARVTTLEEIVSASTARRKILGLSQIAVDDIAGLQTGYTGKLECGDKGLGKLSLPLLLGALKLELAVVPAVQPATSQFRDKNGPHDDFFSRRARKARAAQLAKQTPKQRRAIARAAGKASARKRKAERERTSP